MKNYLILLLVIPILFSCDDRTLDPENAKHAWLHVNYNDDLFYSEVLNETDDSLSVIIDLPNQTQITLEKFVHICYQGYPPDDIETYPSYVVWAKKADYYTQCAQGFSLDTLQINASGGFAPVVPGEVCGTIYTTAHFPFTNYEFYILQDSVIVDSFTTSSNGYFNIDIAFGNYQICESDFFDPIYFEEFNIASFYDDYVIVGVSYEEKPNIYIYPEKKIKLDVSINFPHGGNVTTSIPEYGDGWKNLSIEPFGKINNEFTFLFYESQNPDLCQYDTGWFIAQENLESFFIQNLADTGFKGQEIIDFIDYWIPRLTDSPYYAIYPQYKDQLDKMVELEFSVQPENVLRLIYAIEGREDDLLKLENPEIPEFKREGFFVVEWGVSIRKETLLSSNK